MMDTKELHELLERTGALLTGHFKLSSGLHSDKYVQCAKILQYPELAEQIGTELVKKYNNLGIDIPDLIASPAIGGIVIGQEVAEALTKNRKSSIRHIFVEKDGDGKPTLRRGFSIVRGEKFAVVEDVITTGKSTFEVVDLLERLGGKLTAILSIIDRTGKSFADDMQIRHIETPYISLVKLELNTYEPDNCPLCAKNIPIEKPGSRKI